MFKISLEIKGKFMHSHFAHLFFHAIKRNPVTSFIIEDPEIIDVFKKCIESVLGEEADIFYIDYDTSPNMEQVMKNRYTHPEMRPAIFIGPRLFVYQTFYANEYYRVDNFEPGEEGRGRVLVEITAVKVNKALAQNRDLESLVFDPVLN